MLNDGQLLTQPPQSDGVCMCEIWQKEREVGEKNNDSGESGRKRNTEREIRREGERETERERDCEAA